ncbi:MAG: GDP-mannose 4,6-dehydratase [Candidatus Firestonebacteria bacterium RIFOXYC2_FULL_39_67]|nr:MAG: GDP-mannose 4,6-dehydratase [Candidatus Firestonebacteria bacterium RIFOXYD2_FULL_39_29]OGF52908.1 MAG: GDP-mannose 4,6-dehydratase [Candidatus Firestonebacteria bacterium RifOxyC12_full_39_7]OGF55905.1 MAG: GDP-mannose 4,6-dehydratase [Candidatus Firestonebacteria bacterium RIFOXYC2_FULL_39_67]
MSKQRVLITGVSGFVGSHLVDFLLNKKNIEIHGADILGGEKSANIESSINKIKFHACDLRQSTPVRKLVKEIKPDRILHLAGSAFVGDSWSSPQNTFEMNVFSELNIFNALVELRLNPWIQIACSSEEYGLAAKKELPISEKNELRPLSPYAVSKIAQDYLGYQYFKSYGLKVVRTRSFNHIGPRQNDKFVVSNFAKQIAMIEKGKQEPFINVGNLDSVRDFTDVRDIVKAYWLCTEKGIPGEVYNLCSGKGYKISEILRILLSFSKVKVKIKIDPKKMRLSDVPVWVGDNRKFVKQTGWKLEYSLKKTLSDTLDYWRGKVK